MAHQWLRTNLLASAFPLLSDLWGQTIIQPQADIANTNFGPDNINKPQLFYAENVMPTSAGYQSISWTLIQPTPAAGVPNNKYFNQIFELKVPNTSGNPSDPAFISVYVATGFSSTGGLWYCIPGILPDWIFLNIPYAATVTPMQISTAFCNGQTYIYLAYKGAFHFDLATANFIADAFIGVTTANIAGITATNGYIIAYGANFAVWNSNQNPLDFTPSLITGAGGGAVSEVKSEITGCYGISGGFIIYTDDNAVQAAYTGNVNFPFKFQEIAGSGGVSSNSRISWQDDSSSHFIFGNKGMQLIQIGADAQSVFPEVTEMLTIGYVESFNLNNLTFHIAANGSDFSDPLINLIGTRYLCISYDRTLKTVAGGNYINYSRAIIYDAVLKRWGKIVLDHVDIIDYEAILPGGYQDLSPRGTLGTVDYLGNFYRLNSNFTSQITEVGGGIGVLLFGKFQLQRNKGVYLQRAALENLFAGQNWNAYAIATLDGKTQQPPQLLADISSAAGNGTNIRTFGGDNLYGLNISLLLIGNFNISSIELDLVQGSSY